ncbi:MAG: hypothetical protein KGJ79_17755 [Alphaproteobacteria bacterium]|nr:hypothetical protein [Alphaproteobacteria bacterium]MDE2112986.1 hypothetical protein [Alphaproteobacteria bacterium]MDE2492321.1 hypothetical protein [Alphaproteobacteria bacterium]
MYRTFVFVMAGGLALSGVTQASSLADALAGGKPLVDVRLRYEGVNDDNCALCAGKDADAKTLRARLGYETGTWNGFSALAEFDQIWSLGPEDYDSKSNGHTTFPLVADPQLTTLNRLQLSYSGIDHTTITAGRQEIVLGDARFIGNVGFRQHEQTFDGVSVVNTSLPDTKLFYAWIGGVNRVFGPGSHGGPAIGHYISDSHLFNAVYTGVSHLKLESYVYLLDLKEAPAASTATYGARAEWREPLSDGLSAMLVGALAHQNEYASNPNKVSLDYWTLEGGLAYAGFNGGIGYEAMGGNGKVGFSTPLATLHAFDGWADLFLATPVNGIDDFYGKLSYVFKNVLGVARLAPQVVYHSFTTDRTNVGIGNEWDLALNAAFDKHFSLNASYGSYDGAGVGQGGFKDKSITWLTASYKY